MLRTRPSPRDDVIQFAIRIGLLAFLVYWSFLLVRPFIPILVWSMVLAVALYPAYSWLAGKLGGRNALAAMLITVLSLIVVIGPAAWLGLGLIEGLRAIAEQLAAASVAVPEPPSKLKDWPLVGDQIFELWSLASTNLDGALKTVMPHLRPVAGPVLGMAAGAGAGILKFLLSLALMGFLFLPGPRLVRGVRTFLMHVIPERSDEFLALAGLTIRTISRGVIGIAVLQSLLAGIGFKMAGVPGAGILTIVALFLGIIQIGPSIVILGVLAWCWSTMETTAALLFTAYLIPVSLLDNVLKPIVMGHGLKTPMLVIFIGVLGGTIAHGIVGLFVGPIILAVGWELLAAWMREGIDGEGPATADPAQ
ncbi:MAG TPA: AI-2E family transporter [Pyrinomonadaceae bacterium]|nr:AI-2E family transporter [Pyrinomonadaceae bacterium]